MGNQGSSHGSTASVSSLTTTKSNLLSLKSDFRSMKSDASFNQKRIPSTCEEQLIKDLQDMNKYNETKKGVVKTSKAEDYSSLIPTVFRWHGKGSEVFISGSFNSWKENICMKKSENAFYTIINCTPGHHSYKFLVDGIWMHDVLQMTEDNPFGTLNNCINVAEEDLDIGLALSYDELHSKKAPDGDYNENPDIDYGQDIPRRPNPVTGMTLKNIQPQPLPPYLSETILNIEVGPHNDPTLLTTPYHVQINHLYASSISSGIASLSVTVRYRTKYITTLFYKSISD